MWAIVSGIPSASSSASHPAEGPADPRSATAARRRQSRRAVDALLQRPGRRRTSSCPPIPRCSSSALRSPVGPGKRTSHRYFPAAGGQSTTWYAALARRGRQPAAWRQHLGASSTGRRTPRPTTCAAGTGGPPRTSGSSGMRPSPRGRRGGSLDLDDAVHLVLAVGPGASACAVTAWRRPYDPGLLCRRPVRLPLLRPALRQGPRGRRGLPRRNSSRGPAPTRRVDSPAHRGSLQSNSCKVLQSRPRAQPGRRGQQRVEEVVHELSSRPKAAGDRSCR